MSEGIEGGTSLEETELPIDDLSESEEITDGTTLEIEDEGDENETARQTVERLLKRQSEREDGQANEQQVARGKSAKGQGPGAEDKNQEAQSQSQSGIAPPQRLSVDEKERFNKLPRWAKHSIAEMVQNHEGQFSRAMQHANAAMKEASGILETVRPYMQAHPELVQRGMTESSFVAGLVGAHMGLTATDKAGNPHMPTRISNVISILSQIGITQEQLDSVVEVLQGGASSGSARGVGADISSHPQFLALQNQLQEVISYVKGIETQKFNAVRDAIVQELVTMRDEKDQASGRYLWPEMHDNSFLERVKPLVDAHQAATPGMKTVEAMRRAILSLRSGDSSMVNPAGLPPANNQTIDRAARAGAITVRGRVSPQASNGVNFGDAPEDALKDGRSTTAWVIEQLRNGGLRNG